MYAKALLLLPLLLSLLCAGPVAPASRVEAPRDPGACVRMACVKGCCTNGGCCEGAQQQQAPKAPTPLAPRVEFQLTAPALPFLTAWVAYPPTARQTFIQADEKCGGHTLPPRMASCIQLI